MYTDMSAASNYGTKRDQEHLQFMALGSENPQTPKIHLINLGNKKFYVKYSARHSSRGQ